MGFCNNSSQIFRTNIGSNLKFKPNQIHLNKDVPQTHPKNYDFFTYFDMRLKCYRFDSNEKVQVWISTTS